VIEILKGGANESELQAIEAALIARARRQEAQAAGEFGKPILRAPLERKEN